MEVEDAHEPSLDTTDSIDPHQQENGYDSNDANDLIWTTDEEGANMSAEEADQEDDDGGDLGLDVLEEEIEGADEQEDKVETKEEEGVASGTMDYTTAQEQVETDSKIVIPVSESEPEIDKAKQSTKTRRKKNIKTTKPQKEKENKSPEKPILKKTNSKLTRKEKPSSRDGLFKQERDYIALKFKKLRAIARKAPVQVRIWTEPRKVQSPMDKYVCAIAEAVCSDIFWSAMRNDLVRLRHLVKVEGISVHNTLDPWMMHQTPLHWAAKGGAVDAIEYLIECGADIHKKDDNGSIPLHLACWAGHTLAAMALLRAGDLKDLLIADYDANLNSLEWAGVRQHTQCIADINKFCDSIWLPKFIEELIWKILLKTKMKTAEEKQREEQLAIEREEFKRLQQLAEQAKQAANLGENVVLDSSDAPKVEFTATTTSKEIK